MKRIKLFNRYVYLLLLLFAHLGLQAKEMNATISLYNLFGPDTDMENGIKGTVNSGGRIEVRIYEKSLNVLIYHTYITTSSLLFAVIFDEYNKSTLGSGATIIQISGVGRT